ncbi:hypothetical protein [Conexibacter woesei]|uniref:hypothetical protein n=1 Tax=Conexibacter woesei TaxID=191495 RepID=UPI0003F62305|nr:hypothetical protein [Conexibacter woesei]
MSHAVRRPLTAAVVATCSLALIGAPAAGAKTKSKPKISKTDRAQNAAIRKVGRTATSASRSARSASRSATAGLAAAAAASRKADGAQGGVNTILAGVPAITDGLQKLAAGLTQAAAGLTTIGNALAAQEYGTVKIQLGTTDVPGAILNSSDIPDDSNGATLTGTVIVPVPAGATGVPIRLLAGVRSGEADGTGAGDPVASAGIVSMSAADASGGGVTIGGGDAVLTRAPLTSAPNDALGRAPLYNIPNKAPRVDATPNPLSFPDADAIDLTDASTLYRLSGAPIGPFTVTNPTGTALPVTVTFTVRFHDLTASATDVTA